MKENAQHRRLCEFRKGHEEKSSFLSFLSSKFLFPEAGTLAFATSCVFVCVGKNAPQTGPGVLRGGLGMSPFECFLLRTDQDYGLPLVYFSCIPCTRGEGKWHSRG